MIELLMSQASVKRLAIAIPIYAVGVSYPARNGASASESPSMRTPESVRSARTLPDIFAIILSSSSCFVSSRTVIV